MIKCWNRSSRPMVGRYRALDDRDKGGCGPSFLSGSCIRVAPGSDHWLIAAAL